MNSKDSCAIARRSKGMPIEDRLARDSYSDGTGCILWKGGSQNNSGYGLIYHAGRKRLVHRVAYELFKGPIPRGMQILHACDKKLCVNPLCLSVGTQYENEQDKKSKKRHRFGERHNLAKLTENDVLEIRSDFRPRKTIAAQYGIHPATVTMIRSRRIWRHI